MKIFAYYLPQYHTIPENDEWWGKGFTEWTNVKKAKPLFKGHHQPVVPLNNNYYDLKDVNTLVWQSELMNKYKIDGLIFYHYYFKGKKLLEKPCEMLLENKNINIPFFFCWANHDWYKSWKGSKELLVKQEYGNEEDWEKHFQYLLPFFKDERYQKKNNKPILMVFKSDFVEKDSIFSYLNKKCKENGFEGIYIIESKNEYNSINEKKDYSNSIHFREPTCSWNIYKKSLFKIIERINNKVLKKINIYRIIKYDGNKIYKIMCNNVKKEGIKGAFFEWDNTSRHSYRGYIIKPVDKRMFEKYMNLIKDEEFLFINAWNEWCEGMMLEPTEHNKYKYLEWIKEWKEKVNENE